MRWARIVFEKPFDYTWPDGSVSSFAAGDRVSMLPVEGHMISTAICYEVTYPKLARQAVHEGSEVGAVLATMPEVTRHFDAGAIATLGDAARGIKHRREVAAQFADAAAGQQHDCGRRAKAEFQFRAEVRVAIDDRVADELDLPFVFDTALLRATARHQRVERS